MVQEEEEVGEEDDTKGETLSRFVVKVLLSTLPMLHQAGLYNVLACKGRRLRE